MSREALQESLSAVMDNEADELEVRRVLAACEDDALRSTWSRYQVARAVMRQDLLEPRLDIAAAVSAALASEAAPAKAKAAAAGAWAGWSRLAVAASVTVAVLGGVRLYNQDAVEGMQQVAQQVPSSALALPQAQGPAVLAGYNISAAQPLQSPLVNASSQSRVGWHELRLPAYLRQHAQQANSTVTGSSLPYARSASLENR
ncbi:MAG: RseA family anti-sigma factor [Pseudomonas sp.]|uniref:RseA family anti-sigma factor n=1 Tax=Pseudomonas sp. TaxID=306 RepID=UPI003398F1BA